MKQKMNFFAGLIGLLACTSLQAGFISAEAYVQYEFGGVNLAIVEDTSSTQSLAEAASIFDNDSGDSASIVEVSDTLDDGVQKAEAKGEISASFGFANAFAEVVDSNDAEAEAQIGAVFEVLEDGVLNIDVDGVIDVTDLLNTQGAVSFSLDVFDLNGGFAYQNSIDLLDSNIGDGFEFDVNVLTGYEVVITGFAEAFASHPENVAQISEPATGMLLVLGSTLLIGLMKRRNQ